MVDSTLDIKLSELIEEGVEKTSSQKKQQCINSRSDQKNRSKNHLVIFEKTTSSHLASVVIEVDKILTEEVYLQAINLFKGERLEGFTLFSTPKEYLEMNYKSEIAHRVKQYLFHHFVLDFLFRELARKKIMIVNTPRLTLVDFKPGETTRFHFNISIADAVELKEWKHFSFKTPKRKKYKDLDKQVINFIEQENILAQQQKHLIEEADWVLFTSALIDHSTREINYPHLTTSFWIKVQFSSMPNSFAQEFVDKKIRCRYQGDFPIIQQLQWKNFFFFNNSQSYSKRQNT